MHRLVLTCCLLLPLFTAFCAEDICLEDNCVDAAEALRNSTHPQAEELRTAVRQIEQEKRFSVLRERRRALLQEMARLTPRIGEINDEITSLEIQREELKADLISFELPDEVRLAELKSRVHLNDAQVDGLRKKIAAAPNKRLKAEFTDQLQSALQSQSYLHNRLRDITTDYQNDAREKEEIKRRIAEITVQIDERSERLRMLENTRQALMEEKFRVEDAINVLLVPENARNEFKLYITGAFSMLVALVITGFFVVAFRDEQVRRSIFSSEAGIQFLTLFSLVIAIILFGITNILGSKELAALLGGLSGYILGRATEVRA